MQTANLRRRRRRGVTIVETLVASLILGTGLAAVVSMWYASYSMSNQTDTKGIAYAIGRHALEEVKETGFRYAMEGTTNLYYDSGGANESTAQGTSSIYQVTTTITSDKLSTSSTGSQIPADDALRTVVLTVTYLPKTQTLYSTGTFLVRSGL